MDVCVGPRSQGFHGRLPTRTTDSYVSVSHSVSVLLLIRRSFSSLSLSLLRLWIHDTSFRLKSTVFYPVANAFSNQDLFRRAWTTFSRFPPASDAEVFSGAPRGRDEARSWGPPVMSWHKNFVPIVYRLTTENSRQKKTQTRHKMSFLFSLSSKTSLPRGVEVAGRGTSGAGDTRGPVGPGATPTSAGPRASRPRSHTRTVDGPSRARTPTGGRRGRSTCRP